MERIDEAIVEFFEYLATVKRVAPNTITGYRYDLARFQRFAQDTNVALLADIRPQLVERWMGSMRGLSDASVRRALNALSSLFRWAESYDYVQTNPVGRVQRPKKRPRIQPCPTLAEVSAMLQAAKGLTERAVLLAMATSGLRRAEALGLRWENVDLPRRCLRILGKGSKERKVHVFDELLAALYALSAEASFPTSGPVFCGRRGRPLQQSTLQAWMNKWLKAAGLRDGTCKGTRNRYCLHSFRRFAATQWLRKGINIRDVQVLLGHDDIKTTMIYLSSEFEDIQRAASQIDFGLAPRPMLADQTRAHL